MFQKVFQHIKKMRVMICRIKFEEKLEMGFFSIITNWQWGGGGIDYSRPGGGEIKIDDISRTFKVYFVSGSGANPIKRERRFVSKHFESQILFFLI